MYLIAFKCIFFRETTFFYQITTENPVGSSLESMIKSISNEFFLLFPLLSNSSVFEIKVYIFND